MSRGYVIFLCVLILALLNGCGDNQSAPMDNQLGDVKQADTQLMNDLEVDHAGEPPAIDHLETYPFPVPADWNEEKFEVREYDEGMEWVAIFTFEGNEQEQALDYKEIIEELGYKTQTLLHNVFKIDSAEFAGNLYHGTFTFDIGDEYSEWGNGQGYVEITFSEKR